LRAKNTSQSNKSRDIAQQHTRLKGRVFVAREKGNGMQIIDSKELAQRIKLPETWVRSQTRARTATSEQIPHLRFGRYVRFDWDSPALAEWLQKRSCGGAK
jgi:hypothetical protein